MFQSVASASFRVQGLTIKFCNMSGYNEMIEINHDLGEKVKPTTEALPMYHLMGQDQTATETSAFQEACCFPVENETKKEDDDDTSIIPEKYLNVS